MPKMKKHSGAKKRFKVTGTGKIRRNQAMLGHLMINKSARRERRLTGQVDVSPGDRRHIRKLIQH